MASGRNVYSEGGLHGTIFWYGEVKIGKKDPYLLTDAVEAVARALKFKVFPTWREEWGIKFPGKVGPFLESPEASKALQEINNYYVYLLSCTKNSRKPLEYIIWKRMKPLQDIDWKKITKL